MPAYVRKVKTASGATAVQIVEKRGGVRRIVKHFGSAHNDAELAVALMWSESSMLGRVPPPPAGDFRSFPVLLQPRT